MSDKPTIQFPTGPLPPDYFTADRSDILKGVGIAFVTLTTVAFSLRIVARKIKGTKFGWDDAFMIPAWLCNLAVCIVCFLSLEYGVGSHTLAEVKANPSWATKDHKHLAALTLIALPITYLFAVTFSKLAILNLFLRIFQQGIARHASIAVGAVTTVKCIVCTVVTVMQCTPASLTWSSTVRPTCIDVTEFFRLSAVPNVTTDLIMLVLPLPQVWRLNASTRIKVGITVTLLLASIGIISSVLRFVELIRTNIFSDPLWFDVNLLAYTIAEPGTLFLAACFVTYRPLLKHISAHDYFTRMFSTHRTAPTNGATDAWKIQPQSAPCGAKQQPRGFNSILLSAVSRNDKSGVDSAHGTINSHEALNRPNLSLNGGNNSSFECQVSVQLPERTRPSDGSKASNEMV